VIKDKVLLCCHFLLDHNRFGLARRAVHGGDLDRAASSTAKPAARARWGIACLDA